MPKQPKKPVKKKPQSATGGRPTKPADQIRAITLKIRLTESERKALDFAASGESLEVSSWARAVLLREARRLQTGEHK